MADPNLRCYICGCVAEGKLFPHCCKCSMLVCRQHRDKNGFFTQTYSCFPVCRPPAMRIPWAQRVALQLQVEEDRRKVAAAQEATQNGTGCDALTMTHDDDDAFLPKRVVAVTSIQKLVGTSNSPLVRMDEEAVSSKPRTQSAASKSEQATRGLHTAEVLLWQQSIAAPTPNSSPGAMKELAKPSQVASRPVPHSKCSEAPSTKIEEWFDNDHVVRPDDSEEEDEANLPMRVDAVAGSSCKVPMHDDQYLPIRYPVSSAAARGAQQLLDAASAHQALDDGGEFVTMRLDSGVDMDDYEEVTTNHTRREFAFARV